MVINSRVEIGSVRKEYVLEFPREFVRVLLEVPPADVFIEKTVGLQIGRKR